MRTSVAVLTLLFASLLLVAGCGNEQSSAPSGSQDEPASTTTAGTVPATTAGTTPKTTAPETTAPETTADGTPDESATVTIINFAGERIEVEAEIADEPDEQQRGLMERTELAENAGMLFVFDRELQAPFTMRNTLIPLSIAFIDAQGRIVTILDMQPLDEITPYSSAAPYRYALEVNQGFFAERGIGVGDVVELPQLSGSAGTPGSTEVVRAFQDAGLQVEGFYPVEEEPGWGESPVPKTYEEATRFEIPSLGNDPSGNTQGGRVFVFGSEGDLAAVRDYYEGLQDPARPYIYTEGEVLVQLNNQLPEAEAERYGAVLRETV